MGGKYTQRTSGVSMGPQGLGTGAVDSTFPWESVDVPLYSETPVAQDQAGDC